MKVSEFIKRNKGLLVVYFFSIVVCFFLFSKVGADASSIDTSSYINAISSLRDGHLDEFRTPIYPFLLGVFRTIFGDNLFLTAVVIFQHLVFLISIYFFYRVGRVLEINEKVSLALCLIYGCVPIFNVWNNRIMTECLAISLSVILLYVVAMQIVKKKTRYSLWLFLLLLVLIFLRPIFIYLIPICLLFYLSLWALKSSKEYRNCFIATLLATGIVLCYIGEFKREFGIYSLSTVSLRNAYYCAVMDGFVEPSDFESLSPSEMSEYVKNIKKDKSYLFSSIAHRGLKSFDSLLFFRLAQYHIRITMGNVYFFVFLYFIILMINSSWKKRISWLSFLILVLFLCNVIVAIIGAQAEWNRLSLPSIPFVLLMIGQILSPINRDYINRVDFK